MKRYDNKLIKKYYKCIVSKNKYTSYYYLKDISLLEIKEGDLYIPIKDCTGVSGRQFLKDCELKLQMYNRNEKLNQLLNEN